MLAQQVFNGLALGMGYALIAVGYSLVFGILRLVNFSHGSIYAFGAEIAMVFIVSMKFGIVPGILLSILVTGALGIMIDKIALEPLRKKGSPPIASLITTIGISNIITNLLIVFIGSEKRNFPNIVMGLCCGHDSLFYKYAEGLTTTLVVKDRVLGNNPVQVLYQTRSYYRRLLAKPVGEK